MTTKTAKTTNTPKGTRLQEKADAGVGALVWWDFESVKITPDQMRATLKRFNLDSDIEVPDIDHEVAVRKTASSYAKSNGRGFGSTKIKAEWIKTYDDGIIEVALLKHEKLSDDRQASKKVRWEHFDTVLYDLNQPGWLFQGSTPEASTFVKAAQERIDYLGYDFVRSKVVNGPLTGVGAFPLRKRQGGFYFVPGPVVDLAERIAACLDALPCDCALNVAHFRGTGATVKSVGESARAYLEDGLGSIRQRLAAWTEAQRTPRQDAVATVMAEFVTLRDHADLYKAALQVELGDLISDLDEAKVTAVEIAGAATAGFPPYLKGLMTSIAKARKGAIVSVGNLEGMGLPKPATTKRYWTSGHGAAAAKAAGVEAAWVHGEPDGVRFGTAEPVPEPEVKAEEKPEKAAPKRKRKAAPKKAAPKPKAKPKSKAKPKAKPAPKKATPEPAAVIVTADDPAAPDEAEAAFEGMSDEEIATAVSRVTNTPVPAGTPRAEMISQFRSSLGI